jgi:hypothetical protein
MTMHSPVSRANDLDLEERAAALVNPVSGLANDYLNIFNEIVMMIDLLPQAPALAEDIEGWRPVSYSDYFADSPLPGRHRALAAYEALEPSTRTLFDKTSRDLARLARGACVTVIDIARRDQFDGPALARACADAAECIRDVLDRLTQIVNHGEIANDDVQARADRIFSVA